MLIDPTDPVLKLVLRHLPDVHEYVIEDLVNDLHEFIANMGYEEDDE